MAYVNSRTAGRPSTTLISARIQQEHINYASRMQFNFNKWANTALESLVHDLQTDYNVEKEKRTLKWSCSTYTAYHEDGYGSVPKMLRIQTHLLEYLKLNGYKVNACVNLAFERWKEYHKDGRVADYVIHKLRSRSKY